MKNKDNNITVILDIKNQEVWEEFKKAVENLDGFTVCRHSHDISLKVKEPGTYDLLIIEMGEEYKNDLQIARNLKEAGIAREIFFTSANLDPALLVDALRMGVKEFFPQPINGEEVKNALIKIKEYKENKQKAGVPSKKGKIINVFGSKGGVGTTTVAVNLAVSLVESEETASVALIDMKPVFGEVPVSLNIEPSFSWLEVTKNISRLDPTYLMSILHKHSSGIYVLPSPSEFVEQNQGHPLSMATLIKFMQTIFDYIVIDSGQIFDQNSPAIMKMADKVLLICTLNLPCIINLKKLMVSLEKLGLQDDKNIEIIVNRFQKTSDISLKEVEESLQKKVCCCIPNAYKLSMSAINQGSPLYKIAHGSEVWRKYSYLASTFAVKRNGNGKLKKTERSFFPFASLFSER